MMRRGYSRYVARYRVSAGGLPVTSRRAPGGTVSRTRVRNASRAGGTSVAACRAVATKNSAGSAMSRQASINVPSRAEARATDGEGPILTCPVVGVASGGADFPIELPPRTHHTGTARREQWEGWRRTERTVGGKREHTGARPAPRHGDARSDGPMVVPSRCTGSDDVRAGPAGAPVRRTLHPDGRRLDLLARPVLGPDHRPAG